MIDGHRLWRSSNSSVGLEKFMTTPTLMSTGTMFGVALRTGFLASRHDDLKFRVVQQNVNTGYRKRRLTDSSL
jgi:hypothetical protein